MYWFDIPDELLPPVYRSIKDMYAYARTLDTELRDFLAVMYYIRGNFFVQTCDSQTLSEWISLLDIPMYGEETTEDKRRLVLTYLNNQRPATEPFFRSMLDEIFGVGGYTMELDPNDSMRVLINFIDQQPPLIRQFSDWFLRMIPAHILWDMGVIEPSKIDVMCTSNAIMADKMRMTASFSYGSDATLYLGDTELSADWIEL